jgi:FAD/FMN-containing dehydrogenase
MNRRQFLKTSAAAAVAASLAPYSFGAASSLRRVRPSDAAWPSESEWNGLKDAVGDNLIKVQSPIDACRSNPAECEALFANLKNPYYLADEPALTETLGWVDAWTSRPSVYAVAARNAYEVAAAVKFARKHNLRLVIKGRGHSYQGTSNAPDSLLIWTRYMQDIVLHARFVPQQCESMMPPQRAVTLGSGAYWLQAYDAVTTRAGGYVQGGGCTTVGVAGLVQSGGFGSFSKYYGTAAAGLLEAEVVTADGRILIVNARLHPDLLWALKGGGGGTFAVITRLTLRVRDLPEWAGGADFWVKAQSGAAYRHLVRRFVDFYADALFNEHWGEQAHFYSGKYLGISMVHLGLTTDESQRIWKPFLDWIKQSPADYEFPTEPIIGSMPARHWWDVEWRKEQHQDVLNSDSRDGASPNNVWWKGTSGEVGWVISGYESLWMPESLLQSDKRESLADALLAASRQYGVSLHFNKGLAGAPPEAIDAARDTATNPSVCTAFALAIVAKAQGPAYPGIPGHEPDLARGRDDAETVRRAMNELRAVAANSGAYVSESDFFENGFQQAYWGDNHARLARIKQKYDPDGLFYVHNGVGSEAWSDNGFTRR